MAIKNRIIEKETFNLNNLRDLCRDSPILVINTPCGVGKYTFNKIIYDENNDVVFEYRLIGDELFRDTTNIRYNLGEYFRMTAEQLVYTFKYYANS